MSNIYLDIDAMMPNVAAIIGDKKRAAEITKINSERKTRDLDQDGPLATLIQNAGFSPEDRETAISGSSVYFALALYREITKRGLRAKFAFIYQLKDDSEIFTENCIVLRHAVLLSECKFYNIQGHVRVPKLYVPLPPAGTRESLEFLDIKMYKNIIRYRNKINKTKHKEGDLANYRRWRHQLKMVPNIDV